MRPSADDGAGRPRSRSGRASVTSRSSTCARRPVAVIWRRARRRPPGRAHRATTSAPGGGQRQCQRAADAAGRAGHERDAAVEREGGVGRWWRRCRHPPIVPQPRDLRRRRARRRSAVARRRGRRPSRAWPPPARPGPRRGRAPAPAVRRWWGSGSSRGWWRGSTRRGTARRSRSGRYGTPGSGTAPSSPSRVAPAGSMNVSACQWKAGIVSGRRPKTASSRAAAVRNTGAGPTSGTSHRRTPRRRMPAPAAALRGTRRRRARRWRRPWRMSSSSGSEPVEALRGVEALRPAERDDAVAPGERRGDGIAALEIDELDLDPAIREDLGVCRERCRRDVLEDEDAHHAARPAACAETARRSCHQALDPLGAEAGEARTAWACLPQRPGRRQRVATGGRQRDDPRPGGRARARW